jgi:DNA polymerase III epsilon subunit-like protein
MKIDMPKYVLAMDSETTGLAPKSADPTTNSSTGEVFQAISWGLAVVDIGTFQVVETYDSHVHYIPGMAWAARAEQVHGLSKERLLAEGKPEEDVLADICELILKYWGSDTPVIALGHNVAFDLAFFRGMTNRHGINIRFSNRVIDTNSLAMVLENVTGSDQMFERFGLPPRTSHSAMEDIIYTIHCAAAMRDVYTIGLQSIADSSNGSS